MEGRRKSAEQLHEGIKAYHQKLKNEVLLYWLEQKPNLEGNVTEEGRLRINLDYGSRNPLGTRYIVNLIGHLKAYPVLETQLDELNNLVQADQSNMMLNFKPSINDLYTYLNDNVRSYNVKVGGLYLKSDSEKEELKKERQRLVELDRVFKDNLQRVVDDIDLDILEGECIQELRQQRKD